MAKTEAAPAKILPSDKEWDDFRAAIVKSVRWLEYEDRIVETAAFKYVMMERISIKAKCPEGVHDFDVCPKIARILTRNVGWAMDRWTRRFSFVCRGSKILCEIELTRGKKNLRAEIAVVGTCPIEINERSIRTLLSA